MSPPDGAQVYWRRNTPSKRYIELTSLRPIPALPTIHPSYTDYTHAIHTIHQLCTITHTQALYKTYFFSAHTYYTAYTPAIPTIHLCYTDYTHTIHTKHKLYEDFSMLLLIHFLLSVKCDCCNNHLNYHTFTIPLLASVLNIHNMYECFALTGCYHLY